MFVECPLCGALVPQNEIKIWGYCKICRQLVEVLIGHAKGCRGAWQKHREEGITYV